MAAIDENEFARWMELLRADIRGVHERLDALNGRTRKNENDISVLQERSGGSVMGAAAGGFTGGFVLVVGYLVEKFWK